MEKNNKSIIESVLYVSGDEGIKIIEEMNDMLNTKLKSKNLTTKLVYLGITYSRDLYKRFSAG